MVLHDLNLAARYSDMLAAIIRDGGVYARSAAPEEVICGENVCARCSDIKADVARDAAHDCPYFIPLEHNRRYCGRTIALQSTHNAIKGGIL